MSGLGATPSEPIGSPSLNNAMTLLDRPRTEHVSTQRRDALPERANYADQGCVTDAHGPGHPSCLDCPLPACKYDIGEDPKVERNERIFELRKAGVPRIELARQFNISIRTVDRIIQSGGAAHPCEGRR